MNWWRWAAERGCRQNSPPRWCLEPPRKAISWHWNRRPWAQSRPVTPTRPPLFDAGVLGVEFQGRVYKEGRRPGTKPCVTPTVGKMEGRRGDPEGPLFWVQPNDLQHLTRSKGAGSMGSEQSRLHQLQALRGTWGGSPGPSGCCVGWKDPPPPVLEASWGQSQKRTVVDCGRGFAGAARRRQVVPGQRGAWTEPWRGRGVRP